MKTLDEGIQVNSSTMPLASRLDHLDFVMKYLEGKNDNFPRNSQNGSGSNSVQGQKQFVPVSMDVAAKETSFKGPLMDRVASLEHRIVQLYLAMDTSKTSTSDGLSAQESQRKTSTSSLQMLNNLRGKEVGRQVLEGPENEEKSGRLFKRGSYHIQLGKNKGSQQDSKKCRSQKKGLRSWPHLNFLGC